MKIFGAALLGLLMGTTANATCLPYEPLPVTVSGAIFKRIDPGPPGYGEDPKHDSKEAHLYLTLDAAVCVGLDAADSANSPEAGVRTMQMVYSVDEPFEKKWLGKHVMVTGMLFHQQTGHHWTKVLITPQKTELSGGKAK